MSRERLANAYDSLAEAYAQVAHELRGAIEPSAARADVAPSVPAGAPDSAVGVTPAPAARLPQRPAPESAFTDCPAHKQPFKEGNYGLYCSGKGEPDGNWYNDRGYCKVTPKSAGAWLKQHPKGSPADADEMSF